MSFAITVSIDATRPLEMLSNSDRKIGYALVNALNATAKDIQAKQRANVRERFTVRREQFIMREAAKIDFAKFSTARFQASVSVGQKPRLLLSEFEKGGTRRGFVGKNVAVPLVGGARPSKEAEIPRAFTFAGMRLKAYRGKKRLTRKARGRHVRDFGVFGEFGRLALPEAGNRVQWRGANRTYLVPGVGVFQRTGPESTRLLWAFRPSVRLLPKLQFIVTGTDVARRSFDRHLARQVELEFARGVRRSVAPLVRLLGGAV